MTGIERVANLALFREAIYCLGLQLLSMAGVRRENGNSSVVRFFKLFRRSWVDLIYPMMGKDSQYMAMDYASSHTKPLNVSHFLTKKETLSLIVLYNRAWKVVWSKTHWGYHVKCLSWHRIMSLYTPKKLSVLWKKLSILGYILYRFITCLCLLI